MNAFGEDVWGFFFFLVCVVTHFLYVGYVVVCPI